MGCTDAEVGVCLDMYTPVMHYIYVHRQTHVHICAFTFVSVHVHAQKHAQMLTLFHAHMDMHSCTYTHACTHTHARTHAHTCTHTHTHTHTQMHMNTHTHIVHKLTRTRAHTYTIGLQSNILFDKLMCPCGFLYEVHLVWPTVE